MKYECKQYLVLGAEGVGKTWDRNHKQNKANRSLEPLLIHVTGDIIYRDSGGVPETNLRNRWKKLSKMGQGVPFVPRDKEDYKEP